MRLCLRLAGGVVCTGFFEKREVVAIRHFGRGCDMSVGFLVVAVSLSISPVVVAGVREVDGSAGGGGRCWKSSRDGGGSNDAMHAGLHQSKSQ